jgi:uncharacterized protein (TIGR02266 family)
MSYSGAVRATESRKMLGDALEALQQDRNIPSDVLSVTEHVAKAVGALFEAERASSEVDGRASVRRAMEFISQTLALLQDVRSKHNGIQVATKTLAKVMSSLYPLGQTSIRLTNPPTASGGAAPQDAAPVAAAGQVKPAPAKASGPRERLEANVGATTESNFFVGFSGEISEGGVFIATYTTLPIGTLVDLLVTLPGNYESKIPGKVLFVRDPMDMDAEPGIGVQFETLSKEARELILRFIRKRPPLFFDF